MSTPTKFHNTELDITLLNTPMPKASSTVQRKSTLEDKYLGRNFRNENFVPSSLCGNNMLLKSDDSSLGILNNISTLLGETSVINDKQKKKSDELDAEQELARKLLRKCSNFEGLTSSGDNKKDDVNIETLTNYYNPSDHVDGNSFTYNNDNKLKQQNSTQTLHVEGRSNSVVFEPKEITARSSEMSKSAEKCVSSFSSKSAGGISFDATTAELMAQFNNEEFQSISQMTSHLLADESSWKQNCSYDLPLATSSEKEYLDLSCFSGIIGELDLSVESNAGRKVSIGEFFKRKCGNIGDLSNDIVERPTLGLSINSPKKKNRLIPLVDSTIADGSLTFREKEQTHLTNSTKDIEEHSIMSLSSIAQALQDIDNCTPRRLVDQLIMAKKKRKEFQVEKNDDKGNTYTLLPSSRCSMPATPSALNIKDNKSSKFSLDSKTINKTIENKQTLPRMLSFTSDFDLHTKDTLEKIPQRKSLKKEKTEKSSISFQQQDTDEIKLPDIQSIFKDNKLPLSEMKSDKSGMEREKSFKQENISYTSKMDHSVAQKSTTVEELCLETTSQSHDIIISRNGQEICSCIVGISREADIALTNTGDRWIICSLGTYQLQGNNQNIILHLPKDTILIKPNSTRSVKIGVKITKKTNPAIVILNIITTDMVTRKESIIKHMIYIESEELQVNVLTPFKKPELNFGSIIENTMETLSITLQNKNNVILPIILSVVHDGPKFFSINNLQDGFTHELKPREQFTAVVQCEGTSSLLASAELLKNQLISIEAKLLIQVDNKKDDAVMIKEIPLYVKIGSSKIQVVDTELPIQIPRKQTKSLTIINTGELPLLIAAFIVQDEKSSNRIEDFSVKPETLTLQRNATDRFLITFKPYYCDTHDKYVKIKLSIGNNTYYYSVIGQQNVESENESYLRCETPQQTSDAISPSSPHSVLSSRSGRNSPISSISGSTVAGDKIPIKSTHAALVWGSVKPSKSDTKEFTIRNISDNRIKLQVQICGKNNSFLFLKDHQTTSPNIVLVLHRMESRTLSVVFCPHHVGAAIGKIVFKHYEIKKEENESRSSKAILLYGYGGFGRVIISEIFKDINGKMWLPLGKLNSGEILKAKIKLENIGDLYSYAKVKLIPKAIYPSMVSSWQVNPTELLLEPKETQWITLEFQPRKEDLILLRQRSDVCHVGTINIIYGDEPTRWRIRRLYNKIKNAGDLNGGESEPFRNIVYPLCKVFPGEQLMPDLNLINDTIQNLSDLCHGVSQHEIILTVETNADETLSMIHDSADESQMFYSLYSDNSHVDVESSGKSFLPSETITGGCVNNVRHEQYDDYFTVSPNVVNLIPSIKNEAIVTILSSSRVAQPYETVLSNTDVLSIVPTEGMIPAGKGFPLKIKCKQKVQRNLEATLKIYTENHRQDVKIKIAVVRQ
ncbi:uncharacterized protein LOC118440376 isoform X1 [Vespa mandarinia]|uniref:uncharacterized protein LOC118440376 isoform X1 n=1 Tax=Vespa mandarinia TaxID=7446 RepID=UPI00160AA1FF|nr:uncharacterized protein LOC118440376 isoform X1 [Vespa mandarinia]XP_035719190.1 uncharacterized protein LOC118440376 isoform X1 [Vespa mandarinia]XP_035719191.1 uncharacterized protein LOC118440376 isoform X1 [Vespa mandarinia]